MDYQMIPYGDMWNSGGFYTPSLLVEKYLKLASEHQIKTLLLILNNHGTIGSQTIAKSLGCTEENAKEFIEFWISEGFVCESNTEIKQPNSSVISQIKQNDVKPKEKSQGKNSENNKTKKFETSPFPRLSPKDIVDACITDKRTADLINTIEIDVKRALLSQVEREIIVNMINYYGLSHEIALTILQYCYKEKSNGKSIGTNYISKMAQNWAEEEINTLELADEKLREIENINTYWKRVAQAIGNEHKNPTQNQMNLIKKWFDNFSEDMILYACDIMKENTNKTSLQYVDKILENWLKSNLSTIEDVKNHTKNHKLEVENKTKKKSKGVDKIESAPTYDIDEIERRAMFTDKIDI